jgi:hypothetical protein
VPNEWGFFFEEGVVEISSRFAFVNNGHERRKKINEGLAIPY